MLAKQSFFMLAMLLLSLLGIIACAPALESGSAVSDPAVSDPAAATETAPAPAPVQSNQAVTVATTSLVTTTVAPQPQAQSPGGAAEVDEAVTEPDAQLPASTMATYTDTTYQFSVDYFDNFVLRSPAADQLAMFDPTPVASFRFLNPVIAASDLGDLEPADLEILVFAMEAGVTLESWLTTAGLLPPAGNVAPPPFQTANVSGVEVCTSTMIFPGCFYFVMGGNWIYRLTPATVEGEQMLETFRLDQ